MSEGTPKAIEMMGIVRNATKIGVQDGQAEDLINLRFMDGSWRASGNGRQIVNMPTGTIYQQLYVHTNIYHHLLGVDNGTLYWFAEIGTDGVSFYPLDNTTSRTNWPSDMQNLPTAPVAVTTVVGDVWITQTGHLLSIIDESDDFEYSVFKTGNKAYHKVVADANGLATDRGIYPFGKINFNLYSPWRHNDLDTFDHAIVIETEDVETESANDLRWVKPDVPSDNAIEALGKAAKKNLFINPFLACAAIRLYDGSYLYATNPVLLYPRQVSSSGVRYYDAQEGDYRTFDLTNKRTAAGVFYNINPNLWTGKRYSHVITELQNEDTASGFNRYPTSVIPVWSDTTRDDLPSFMAGISNTEAVGMSDAHATWLTMLLGSDLVCSLSEELADILKRNKDVFSSICIFVTPEVNVYDFDKDKAIPYKRANTGWLSNSQGDTIFFKRKTPEQIYKELVHQPFFLLKEYTEVKELLENPIVQLEEESLLYNLVQKDRLSIEAASRTTYLPKVSYMYNGRLHIANYKSYPFFGYPIDLFHLHNHSVKVQDGAWFKGVLPNLADNNDDYLQYVKAQKAITNYADLVTAEAPYFLVKVYIDSSQGEQVVCRYIPAYNPSSSPYPEHTADFIEDLNPLLTYPDARAKKMEIYYVNSYKTGGLIPAMDGVYVKWQDFQLKPHPYLNMAYYIDPDLKPIKLADFKNLRETQHLVVE